MPTTPGPCRWRGKWHALLSLPRGTRGEGGRRKAGRVGGDGRSVRCSKSRSNRARHKLIVDTTRPLNTPTLPLPAPPPPTGGGGREGGAPPTPPPPQKGGERRGGGPPPHPPPPAARLARDHPPCWR